MTDRSKKITELTAASSAVATDVLVAVTNTSSNAVTKKITVGAFFSNVTANTKFSNTVTFGSNTTFSGTVIVGGNTVIAANGAWVGSGSGLKGEVGSKGDTGTTGSKGDKGQKGEYGDKGEVGAKGDTGSKGDKGDLGTKGDTGAGTKGDKGDTGPNLTTTKFGYSTGGSVTQATSRGTGVSLNALSGIVTLVSAAMTAGQVDTFTMGNSTVGAGDFILCTVYGASLGSYLASAYAPLDGQVVFSIRNLETYTTSAESPVIKFIIIKAATS